MAYILRQFDTGQEMIDYMNGAVQGKTVSTRVYGLHGLSLKINPGGTLRTVTFADADGAGLTPTEIIAQMEDVHSDMVGVAAFRNYRHTTPPSYRLTFHQAGDLIDKTGSANALLGFGTAADTTVGAGAIALADVASVTSDEAGNKFTVIHQ